MKAKPLLVNIDVTNLTDVLWFYVMGRADEKEVAHAF